MSYIASFERKCWPIFSELKKVDKTFFKNAIYQSENKNTFFYQKNFGPNVIYYVFWESGGPSADEVDLEVDLKSFTSTFNTFASGRPQVNLRSTWKSTSSAQVSMLTYDKRDVAIWLCPICYEPPKMEYGRSFLSESNVPEM